MPSLTSAKSLSQHYIEVEFAAPVALTADDASTFEILSPEGESLSVRDVQSMADNRRAIIETSPQSDRNYMLGYKGSFGFDLATVGFVGSSSDEPFLESAIALDNVTVLLTFSEPMDHRSVEDASYYHIEDPDGNEDVDISIREAKLGNDPTTVLLTTTPQRNTDYVIHVTNVKSEYNCNDGQFVALDSVTQGDFCEPRVRPDTLANTPADFELTARRRIDPDFPLQADADGEVGQVTLSSQGAGVQDLDCEGERAMFGSGQFPDEELLITLDEAYYADYISIGLEDVNFRFDAPYLYISAENASAFDFVYDDEMLASVIDYTEPDIGTIRFADLGTLGLHRDTKVDAVKVRETSNTSFIDWFCLQDGRRIDPTRRAAVFSGIPERDAVGPDLLGAVSLSSTSVLLTFSEPISNDSADPVNFEIRPVLTITNVEQTRYETQMILTTSTQSPNADYIVDVSNIMDRAGNPLTNKHFAAFTFAGQPSLLPSSELPRVVGAISSGNTSVIIAFNKPMADSALNPSSYSFVQVEVNPEVGALSVLNNACDDASTNAGDDCVTNADCNGGACMQRNPRFIGPDRTAVEVTTSSQNEVTYEVAVVNVRDQAGNQLAPPEIFVEPNKAQFAGSPPADGTLVDTDGDGLTDNDETRGYQMVITRVGGELIVREVTSDPTLADTDGDGLPDAGERARFSDPRSADTDIDGVPDFEEVFTWGTSITNQDSDSDGLRDSSELNFFKTSPLLADTDGDGLTDDEEIPLQNRDPRISDLPDPGISVGQVALRLDTRFAYTNTQGESSSVSKSTSATLSQSDSKTFSTSDSSTTQHAIEVGLKFGAEASATPKATFEASFSYGYTRQNTFTASQSSTEETQNQFQESLSTSVARDVTEGVTRTVEGASVEVLVTVNNGGDIPFTIRNIELTGLLQDPFDRSTFLPVATLLPASTLEGGGEFEAFLGPFIPERGPFVFKNTEIFPSLVEDLMKNPRGLIFRVANFDIIDEDGRNFAFITQDVNDRTAGLVIDYGNGDVDRFRVSTHSRFDRNECDGASSNAGEFCFTDADCDGGTCDLSNGMQVGVPMSFVLQDILEFQKNQPVDAIIVGENGCAETAAIGDDIQVVVPICRPVPLGGTIIEPGPNGILDTIPLGDDRRDSITGQTIIDGGDGCAHTTAQRDDVQVVSGACEDGFPDGVAVLPGPDGIFQTTPGGDDELATVTGYQTVQQGGCDGSTDLMIDPGNNDLLNSVRAGDDVIDDRTILPGTNGILESSPGGDDILKGPGLNCVTDADCPGAGVCKSVETLFRVKGVKNRPEDSRRWIILTPDEIKPATNFDDIRLHAGQQYSLAFVQDRDADGLIAREEFLYGSSDRDVNSDGCPLGDGVQGCDTNLFDFDTVPDFDEVRKGWQVVVAGVRSYYAFPDPILPDTDTDHLFDDEEKQIGTDPGKRDTDDDLVADNDEVRGYDITRRDGELIRSVVPYQSAKIVPGLNGVIDSILVPDDVEGMDPNGRAIILPGPNGMLDTNVGGDDEIESTKVIIDGGNGVPETTATGDDEQIGPTPVAAATVTVTFLDYKAGGDACDDLNPGEFDFVLRVRQNFDTDIGVLNDDDVIVERYITHEFPDTPINAFLNPGDEITISGTIHENDPQCDTNTRRAVVEPGLVIIDGGNGSADTKVPADPSGHPFNDDIQEVPFGTTNLLPRQVIISAGPNGVLDTVATAGDDLIPVPNGFADTLAVGDDTQQSALAQPVAPGTVIVDCGPDGEPNMAASPADPGICAAFGGNPVRPPLACAPVIRQPTGGDGNAWTSADPNSDDVQLINVGAAAAAGAVIIGPGANELIDSNVATQLIVEPTGGDGDVNTIAAGDDVQLVPFIGTVTDGQAIIAPGPNGVIDTSPGGDDAMAAADDEVVAPFVPTGLDCGLCPLSDCVINCSLCAAGSCEGDDVIFKRDSGTSCEDGFCPCGNCLETLYSEWNFSRSLLLENLANTQIITVDGGPGCFGAAELRFQIDVIGGPVVPSGSVVVRPGLNGVLDTSPTGDDIVGAEHLTYFATNPLDRDTDGDTLFDGAEKVLGANPNDATDASKYRDNDLDGLANIVETNGWFIGRVDELGTLLCQTDTPNVSLIVGDEMHPPEGCRIVTSDPFEPDTDFDGLPDMLEMMIRSDPRNEDTDGDGLLDLDEFDPESPFSVSISIFRAFTRLCADAERCTFAPVDGAHGTSVILADTDNDGRDDREEIFEEFVIQPCIDGEQLPIIVTSDPLSRDADRDGVYDGAERTQSTDPNDPDTDKDGKVDNMDVDPVPAGCGRIVTVSFVDYRVGNDDCDPGSGEFSFSLSVNTPVGGFPFSQRNDDLGSNRTHTFSSNQAVFLLLEGESFNITGSVIERDDGFFGSAAETWYIGARTYSYDDLIGSNAINGPQIIGPQPGEANDNCYDDHQLQVSITSTGA